VELISSVTEASVQDWELLEKVQEREAGALLGQEAKLARNRHLLQPAQENAATMQIRL
jgi:hypothetical protein